MSDTEIKRFYRYSKKNGNDAIINGLIYKLQSSRFYTVTINKTNHIITITPYSGLPYAKSIESYKFQVPTNRELFKIIIKLEYTDSSVHTHIYFYRYYYDVKGDTPLPNCVFIKEILYFEFEDDEKSNIRFLLDGVLREDFSFINNFLNEERNKLNQEKKNLSNLCHRIESESDYISSCKNDYNKYFPMRIYPPSIDEASIYGFLESHYKKSILNKIKLQIEKELPNIIDYNELEYKVSAEIFNGYSIGNRPYIPTSELKKISEDIENRINELLKIEKKMFDDYNNIFDLRTRLSVIKKMIEKNIIL